MTPLEFSRPVAVDRLGSHGKEVTVEANEAECAALARRFDLLGLDRLHGQFRLRPLGTGKLVRVEGHIEAELRQSCVVTLEPITSRIDHEFALSFSSDPEDISPEVSVDPDSEDPPEPIENGIIDLGEVSAQQLALEIDPFPRLPGAKFASEVAEEAETPRSNPFAALAGRRTKSGSSGDA